MQQAGLLSAYQAWIDGRGLPRGDAATAVLGEAAALGVDACLTGSGWPLVLFVAELASMRAAMTLMAARWFCAAAASSELVQESEMYIGLAETIEEEELGLSLEALLSQNVDSACHHVERILAAVVQDGAIDGCGGPSAAAAAAGSGVGDDGARDGDAPPPAKRTRAAEASEIAAAAAAPAPVKVDEIEIARYLFSKLCNEWGDEYKIQKAAFIADAAWAQRHGHLLLTATAEAWDQGPVYPNIRAAVKKWKQGIDVRPANIPNAEVTTLLDRIVVYAKSHTAKELIELTHDQPVWLAATRNGALDEERMVHAYRHDPARLLEKVLGPREPSP